MLKQPSFLLDALAANEPSEHLDDNVEFFPEENASNMVVLEKASELLSTTSTPVDDDDRSDEIPSELLIQDSIPEINEDDSSDDEIVKPLEFKKSHFKKDSSISSSSEDEMSEGLQFPDHNTVDGAQKITPTNNFGAGFMTAISDAFTMTKQYALGPDTPTQTASQPQIIASDEDSEFEIIGESDYE